MQRGHRKRAADPRFQEDYRAHRTMVERSNAWLHLRIAGRNLSRLLNLGLRDSNGTWALPEPAGQPPPHAVTSHHPTQ
ncbi:hypothetical protein [Pseudarthrobacter sp. SSS035]|uniref:hypothetical protein n=1 Tax=Pseudarthrobacter sp. SSS035 TaxID=2931399 RepID=UPI00200E8A81|nr:hypothetical protein [Pseudarthrobacter sp. SSS035]